MTYYEKHRAKAISYSRKYYKKNRERILEQKKLYKSARKDHIKEYNHDYYIRVTKPKRQIDKNV